MNRIIKRFGGYIFRMLVATLMLTFASMTLAQQADVTLNWKDADIRKVVEAVTQYIYSYQ